jgi:hypothetical protein
VPFVVAEFGLTPTRSCCTCAPRFPRARAVISQRTKAALAQKKAQGAKLGGPRLADAAAKASAANRAVADAFAANMHPIIEGLKKVGVSSHAGRSQRPAQGWRLRLPLRQIEQKRLFFYAPGVTRCQPKRT